MKMFCPLELSEAGCLYIRPHPLQEGLLSVQAISWVLDHSQSTLGSRLVLIAIANHAKSDGTGAWPSLRLIARESHLSEREVRYCLRDLEKLGELKTTISGGYHGCNLYSLPHMGAKFSGGKMQQVRGQYATGGGHPIAPEPSLESTVIKQPKPRAQSRSARNRFDDELEQRRKVAAMNLRTQKENEVRKELAVGRGPC